MPIAESQTDSGALAMALLPVYIREQQPSHLSDDTHAENNKRIQWSAYTRILAPLMDDSDEDKFTDGFRSV